MLCDRFTILDLTHLALCYPEAGVVNFNILHTVLTNLLRHLELDDLKIPCHVEDEALAQTFITRRRMEDKSGTRKPPAEVHDVQKLKQKKKELQEAATQSEEEVLPPDDERSAFDVLLDQEDFFEGPPPKVIEEMWRATNVNRRLEAAETGLKDLSKLLDDIFDKVQEVEEKVETTLESCEEITRWVDKFEEIEITCKEFSRKIEDSNEQRKLEVARLEGLLAELSKEHRETKSALEGLTTQHEDLAERVAYKTELEELKGQVSETLELRIKELKKMVREVEDTLVKKDEFMEVVTRIEVLEVNKVDREELGRLLEPGFVDSFMEEQANLRNELEGLKEKVSGLESNLESLCARIEEEVVKEMETNFSRVQVNLDAIDSKLALLDPDEINDSFANLEERADAIGRELQATKWSAEQFQKEARLQFNKFSNVNELLNRLAETKADKTKMYELLETKLDAAMLTNKLDRSEFASVVGEMDESLQRLTAAVNRNEEESEHQFANFHHELALKMYTEDFITATEPVRNRIKALMTELQAVKKIAFTHLFPDAPGVVKCISCKRGAHLAGPQLWKGSGEDSRDVSSDKLLADDLDSVPIPPADEPREQDPSRLPLLFATARPRIGLTHEKRRDTIDKKLTDFFATRPVRPLDGHHIRTLPYQHRVTDFTPAQYHEEKKEILLEGLDKSIYRGAMYDDVVSEPSP